MDATRTHTASARSTNPTGKRRDTDAFRRALGLELPALSTEEVKTAILEHGATFSLLNGWRLTRRLVMGLHRIELEGPVGDDVAAVKTLGCHTEIISYRLRVFVDLDDTSVLASVLKRWPLDQSVAEAA